MGMYVNFHIIKMINYYANYPKIHVNKLKKLFYYARFG
jgi:hypothetical protein